MNKASVILLLILTLILTACSGNASNAAGPTGAGNAPGGGMAGRLSAPMQIAIGTIKLDGTENAVTTEQAKELLPLWETMQDLEGSDTAATEEKDALISQIQETMTTDQTQAITALKLSRQDMFSIMQSQVQNVGGTQNNGTSQNGSTSTNRGGGFGQGGGFMGPPPDGGGGFPGGNPNSQGQSQRTQAGNSGTTGNQPAAIDPNRIPTPLIQAVIEYLKTKAGA